MRMWVESAVNNNKKSHGKSGTTDGGQSLCLSRRSCFHRREVPDSAAVIPYILYSFTAPKRLPFCSCFCAKGIAISTGSVAMMITQ